MVFRSFPKLHQNGSVPHQISPPNSHFKKKKKKNGASCPGYYLTFLNPTLGEALPSDTLSNSGQSLPTKKLAFFHPAAGESHPSRPRVSISGQVTASASRPPNFTFPSLPVRHRGRRREPPGQTTLPFPPHGRLTFPSLPVRHSEHRPPVGRRREPPGQTTLPFLVPRWRRLSVQNSG